MMTDIRMTRITYIVLLSAALLLACAKGSKSYATSEVTVGNTADLNSVEPINKKQTSEVNFTPIKLGSELESVSPYTMVHYSFEKLVGARSFQVLVFTAPFESMIVDGNDTIVAVIFIQRGDLQEVPVAFQIIGELDPNFTGRLSFCADDSAQENELIIYASDACTTGERPEMGIISVQLNEIRNSVLLNGSKEVSLK